MAEALKSANELAAEIRGEDDAAEEKSDDPKAQVEYTFPFEHRESGTGKLRRGKFTNKVLNNGQKRAVGVLAAQLSGGVPWDALPPVDQLRIGKLAHLEVSLAKRPRWARDLESLFDNAIVDKLYEEVADHEATFHGRGEDQDADEGDSGEDDSDGGSDDLASGEASTA
jgi:hypothetical protein